MKKVIYDFQENINKGESNYKKSMKKAKAPLFSDASM